METQAKKFLKSADKQKLISEPVLLSSEMFLFIGSSF